jgi:hypothetical protein
MHSTRFNSELLQLLDTLVALRMELSKDGVPGKPANELSADAINRLCHLATVAIHTTKSMLALEADTAKAAQLCPDWSHQGGHREGASRGAPGGSSPAGASNISSQIGGGNIPV